MREVITSEDISRPNYYIMNPACVLDRIDYHSLGSITSAGASHHASLIALVTPHQKTS
jgi:hypothetical protein